MPDRRFKLLVTSIVAATNEFFHSAAKAPDNVLCPVLSAHHRDASHASKTPASGKSPCEPESP